MQNLEVTFQHFTFLVLSSQIRGEFIFKNFIHSKASMEFINIINSLGGEASYGDGTLTVRSRGALHLAEPKSEIDINGSEALLYALCGIFAPMDYKIFFTNSGDEIKNISPLVLGLFDAGARFSYSKEFTLPMQMKGTSNFLPMKHSIFSENPNLYLAILAAGLSGIGITSVISTSPIISFFLGVLTKIEANTKVKSHEDEALELLVAGFRQTESNKKIEIDLKYYA